MKLFKKKSFLQSVFIAVLFILPASVLAEKQKLAHDTDFDGVPDFMDMHDIKNTNT